MLVLGAKHVTIARKAMSELVAPLLGLNVSRSLLLLLLLLSLPNFLYHVLANLLSPPQNLYLRAHGRSTNPRVPNVRATMGPRLFKAIISTTRWVI